MLATCYHSRITCRIRFQVKSRIQKQVKMFGNVRRRFYFYFFVFTKFWGRKRTDFEWRKLSFVLHYFLIPPPPPPFENPVNKQTRRNVNKLEQKLNQQILPPIPVPSSKEDIDVLANKVYSVITKSYKAACPMRNSLRS